MQSCDRSGPCQTQALNLAWPAPGTCVKRCTVTGGRKIVLVTVQFHGYPEEFEDIVFISICPIDDVGRIGRKLPVLDPSSRYGIWCELPRSSAVDADGGQNPGAVHVPDNGGIR